MTMDDNLDLAQHAAATYGLGVEERARQITEKLGSFNDFPPNFEKITLSEFLWRWSISPAKRIYQYRQARERDQFGKKLLDSSMHELHFWVFPDYSGVGWETHYDGKATRSETDAYTCTYFKFHYCDHEFETTATANCYWEGKCKHCGYVSVVDSSG